MRIGRLSLLDDRGHPAFVRVGSLTDMEFDAGRATRRCVTRRYAKFARIQSTARSARRMRFHQSILLLFAALPMVASLFSWGETVELRAQPPWHDGDALAVLLPIGVSACNAGMAFAYPSLVRWRMRRADEARRAVPPLCSRCRYDLRRCSAAPGSRVVCPKCGTARHVPCPQCFYDLSASAPAPDGCTLCPECGAAWRLNFNPTVADETNRPAQQDD